MAMPLKFCFLLMTVMGTVAATRAPKMAENADRAGDDSLAAKHSRVVDLCRAMLPGEPLGKEPLVLWEQSRYHWGNQVWMDGNWSFVGAGDGAAGEGGLAILPSTRQVAGRAQEEGGAEREEGAAVRRHLLLEAASGQRWGRAPQDRDRRTHFPPGRRPRRQLVPARLPPAPSGPRP